MLDLLRSDVVQESLSARVEVGQIYFVSILRMAYQDQEGYMKEKRYRRLHALGQAFGVGEHDQLALLTNLTNNHWVALVIDFKREGVFYRDSLGKGVGTELQEVLDWWIYLHTGWKLAY